MCLIINIQPKFSISKELMDNFAKRNNDGFGMMWIQDNRLCHMKFGPDKMQDLFSMYESIKAYEGFIHLRMRTHGHTNQEMAHPFNCGYGIYLMHNGVISDSTGDDKSKSDTWYFVNNILIPLFKMSKNPHKLIRSLAFSDLIHKYLGYSNRVVIGDRGGWMMFNSKTWYTISEEKTGCKGMLVSNTYAWDENAYKPRRDYGHNYTVHSSNERWKNRNYGLMEDDEIEYIPPPPPKTTQSSFHIPGPSPASVAEFLEAHFYNLGRNWYADAYGKVYKKRLDNGLDRRADLDEDEQFWNTFSHDMVMAYGEWMSDKHNLDLDTSKVARQASNRRRKPSTQMVLPLPDKPEKTPVVIKGTVIDIQVESSVQPNQMH